MDNSHICIKLEERHKGDKEQLEFIFSPCHRMLVEAPAGYGKTKTMVSKIAYLIATNQIPNPKKILALTFSVNAAYKIKKDVAEQLPVILESDNNLKINDKIFVSNYHGFCRHVLKKYGYLLHENLSKLDYFNSIDDKDIQSLMQLNVGIDYSTATFITNYNSCVKQINADFLEKNFADYNTQVIRYFIPNSYIPYNAILTLTFELFHKYSTILCLYNKYFPIVIIDEFQDTNLLHYHLIEKLITSNTKLSLMGDGLQRIYSFIGAIPNLLSKAENDFMMKKVTLQKNYRFEHNREMLLLDRNIRKNAENLTQPNIAETTEIDVTQLDSQDKEAEYILLKVKSIAAESPDNRIAILFRNGYTNNNTKKILNIFDNQGIEYFFALFSDEDEGYKEFHRRCLNEFNDLLKTHKRISKRVCKELLQRVKKIYQNESNSPFYNALIKLLEVFTIRIFNDYAFLSDEDKIIFVKETFDSYALKQSVESVSSKIIFSTIHGAKGLEWDFVILPDCEQYSIPNWFGLCGECQYKLNCNINYSAYEVKFLEELSIFYVGVTRARKNIFFTASSLGLEWNGKEKKRKLSCMFRLKGIKISEA